MKRGNMSIVNQNCWYTVDLDWILVMQPTGYVWLNHGAGRIMMYSNGMQQDTCSDRRMVGFVQTHVLKRYAIWTCIWTCIVIYGSFIPFQFSSADFEGLSIWGLLTIPQWVSYRTDDVSILGIPGWLSDLTMNVSLYIPLGMFLYLWLSREFRRIGKWGYVVFALPGVLLSYSVEVLQVFTILRVSSIQDILFNALGTLIGCVSAEWMYQRLLRGLFMLHCRLSYPLYRVQQCVLGLRRNPRTMLIVALTNLSVLCYWYVAYRAGGHTNSGTSSWIPFADHFNQSYDVALVNIGEGLVVYMMITMLICVQFMRRGTRVKLSYLVLCIGLMALIREWMLVNTLSGHADLTEPILAMMGAGFCGVSLYLFYHAIQCYDRRNDQIEIDEDRRRVPYLYSNTTENQ